jgi:hypothetical protein
VLHALDRILIELRDYPMELSATEISALETSKFSIKQAKELIGDLHQPISWIYWTDFLCSILVGHVLFQCNVNASRWLSGSQPFVFCVQASITVLTVLLFLRAVMFTHELVHLHAGTMASSCSADTR